MNINNNGKSLLRNYFISSILKESRILAGNLKKKKHP